MILGMCQIGSAQSPTYGVGRTPTAEEMRAWDISIGPTGKGTPAGTRHRQRRRAALSRRRGARAVTGGSGSGAQAPTLIKSDGTTKNPFRVSRRA